MNKILKTILVASLVTFGSSASLLANSVPLNPGDSNVAVVDMVTNSSATVIVDNLNLTTFSTPVYTGTLWSYVLDNFAENTLGGLTFVYTIYNDRNSVDSPDDFSVRGFSGFNVAVAYWQYTGWAQPDTAYRSTNGNVIGFHYIDTLTRNVIDPGQSSYQMVIFTNAKSWKYDNATVQDGYAVNVQTYVPAVPEGGMTALMISLGLLSLGLASRRTKQV